MQLAMLQHLFVNATQRIAIYVILNDNQSYSGMMWRGHMIESCLHFERALAFQMLLD